VCVPARLAGGQSEYGAYVRLYALVEAGDPEAIDVYVAVKDAEQALADCLRDEPQWRGLLGIVPIELDASESVN
jgi:hypothetical protein